MPTRPAARCPTTTSSRRSGRGDLGLAAAAVARRQIELHGQPISFLEAGADSGGPVIVFLHGLASSSRTWEPVLPERGRDAHVIAPDLLGHGASAKPISGDYSLGAYAAELRDLLLVLGVDRATVVGHSFGGGVAMQFAYQFPDLVERVVLVSSGGLGADVTPALRAATLPGASAVLHTAAALTPRWVARLTHRAAARTPGVSQVLSGADLDGLAAALGTFGDGGARAAFVQTVRGALDGAGQRLAGTDRLYLLDGVPVLLVAGSRDPVIPAEHTRGAHTLIPGSRLHVFDDAGHFPHAEHPHRFAALLDEFLTATTPAHTGQEALRRQLQEASTEQTPSDVGAPSMSTRCGTSTPAQPADPATSSAPTDHPLRPDPKDPCDDHATPRHRRPPSREPASHGGAPDEC